MLVFRILSDKETVVFQTWHWQGSKVMKLARAANEESHRSEGTL